MSVDKQCQYVSFLSLLISLSNAILGSFADQVMIFTDACVFVFHSTFSFVIKLVSVNIGVTLTKSVQPFCLMLTV